MLEELQRRHYSEATTRYYIRAVERCAQHFHCSPDRLGRQPIRAYQAQLFTVQKLSPGTVTNHLCALRFFYIQTLKRPWSISDTPYPKKTHRLPTILSQEEVAQLVGAACTPFHRTILMTLYATGVRDEELTRYPIHRRAGRATGLVPRDARCNHTHWYRSATNGSTRIARRAGT
jgi:site-specific recombinase XerD